MPLKLNMSKTSDPVFIPKPASPPWSAFPVIAVPPFQVLRPKALLVTLTTLSSPGFLRYPLHWSQKASNLTRRQTVHFQYTSPFCSLAMSLKTLHSCPISLWVKVKGWHDLAALPLWPHLLLCSLHDVSRPHGSPCLSRDTPDTFSAQGFSTGCFFCLAHVLQVSAWLPPTLPSRYSNVIFSVRPAGSILISNCSPLRYTLFPFLYFVP